MEQKKVRRPLAVRSQRKPKGSGQERRDEIIAAAKELFMTYCEEMPGGNSSN